MKLLSIPICVIDIDDFSNAQADVHRLHRPLTLGERTRLAMDICAEVGNRQGHRTPMHREGAPAIQAGVLTAAFAAKQAGFGSRKTFQRARRVLENGCPELVRAMDEGNLSVSAAAELAPRSKAEQEHILRGGKKALKEFLASRRAAGGTGELRTIALRCRWADSVSTSANRDRVLISGTDLMLKRCSDGERNADLMPSRDPCYLFRTSVMEELQQAINNRQNVILIRPPGDGKTTLVEHVAALVEAPLIVVTGHADLRTHDLLGMKILEHGKIVFDKGPLANGELTAVRMVEWESLAHPCSPQLLSSRAVKGSPCPLHITSWVTQRWTSAL